MKILSKSLMFMRDNQSSIFTGLSCMGVVSTVFLAVKAHPLALDLIDEVESKNDNVDLTVLEKAKLTWQLYLPTAVSGLLTVGCILMINRSYAKKYEALAGLYALSEKTLHTYQDKVREKLGEKDERAIHDEIANDMMKNNPIKEQLALNGIGEQLCYDSMTGRYFLNDIETLRKIQNDFNKHILQGEYISLNELFMEIELDPVRIGEYVGWNVDNEVDFSFNTKIAEDGRPCLILNYKVSPNFAVPLNKM